MGTFARKQLIIPDQKESIDNITSSDEGWFNKLMYSIKTWANTTFAPMTHTHTDITSSINTSSLGALPDFSRATGMYQQATNAKPRIRIVKINVPGYLFFTPNHIHHRNNSSIISSTLS